LRDGTAPIRRSLRDWLRSITAELGGFNAFAQLGSFSRLCLRPRV
jgi:hypothetical protein